MHLKICPPFKHVHIIYKGNDKIGEITFIKKNKILLILFMEIYPEHRNRYYGYKVIEYLLSHYKINCIIGECLITARGFWNKCIHKYNGQRRNIHYSDNCSSSFVIPQYKISNSDIYNLLETFS